MGVLDIHKRVRLFMFIVLLRVILSVFVENKSVFGYDIIVLQYNNDIYQGLANDMGNHPKLGSRQKRFLGILSVKCWALSNSPPTWGYLIF